MPLPEGLDCDAGAAAAQEHHIGGRLALRLPLLVDGVRLRAAKVEQCA